jgi:hypothetical protein
MQGSIFECSNVERELEARQSDLAAAEAVYLRTLHGPRAVRWSVAMRDDYEPSIIQQPDGRWIYRLIPVGGDPAKWESDGHSYLTREDAARSARLALAAKLLRQK